MARPSSYSKTDINFSIGETEHCHCRTRILEILEKGDEEEVLLRPGEDLPDAPAVPHAEILRGKTNVKILVL